MDGLYTHHATNKLVFTPRSQSLGPAAHHDPPLLIRLEHSAESPNKLNRSNSVRCLFHILNPTNPRKSNSLSLSLLGYQWRRSLKLHPEMPLAERKSSRPSALSATPSTKALVTSRVIFSSPINQYFRSGLIDCACDCLDLRIIRSSSHVF